MKTNRCCRCKHWNQFDDFLGEGNCDLLDMIMMYYSSCESWEKITPEEE